METVATLAVGLVIDIGGAIKQLEDGLGKLGTVAAAGGAAIAAGIGIGTAALVAFGKEAVKQASSFESQMAIMSTAVGPLGPPLEDLHKIILQIGADNELIGITASEAAEATTNFFKAGLSANEVLGNYNSYMSEGTSLTGALRAAIDLAAASDLDLAAASELVAISMAQYGLNAEEATGISDAFVKAAGASQAEVSDLQVAMSYVGPTAASMNMSMDDTLVALALLSEGGKKGSSAGTALNRVLLDLTKGSDKSKEALRNLGVEIYDTDTGVMRPFNEILMDLGSAFENMSAAERDAAQQAIFTSQGRLALNILLGQGIEGWDEMAQKVENASTAEEVAAARTDTLQGALESAGGSIETLLISVGDEFLPIVTDLIRKFSEFIVGVTPGVVDGFGLIADAASQFLEGIDFDAIFSAIISGLENIVSTARAVMDVFAGLTSADVMGQLAGNIEAVQTDLDSALSNLASAHAETVANINSEIAAAENNLGATLAGIAERYGSRIASVSEDFAKVQSEINEKIAEANENLNEKLADIAEKATERKEAAEEKYSEAVARINEQIADAGEKLQDKLADIEEKATDKRKAVFEKFAEAKVNIEKKIADATLDLNQTIAEKREALSEKLADIDEQFAKKRLEIEEKIQDAIAQFEERKSDIQDKFADRRESAEEKYTDKREKLEKKLAEATTEEQKAKIQEQIGDLDAGYQKQLAKLDEQEKKELDRLERKHNQAVEKLKKRLADEEAAREAARVKVEEQLAKEEEKLTTKYEREVKKLQEKLVAEAQERDKALAKIDEQSEREVAKATKTHDRAVAKLQERFAKEAQERDKAIAKIDAQAAKEVADAEEKHAKIVGDLHERLAEEEAAYNEQVGKLRQAQADEENRAREKNAELLKGLKERLAAEEQAYADQQEMLKANAEAEIEALKRSTTARAEALKGLEGFRKILDDVREGLAFWRSAIAGFIENITPTLETFGTKFAEVWNWAKDRFNEFWMGLQPSIDAMYERLQKFWTEIQPKLMEAWQALQVLWFTVVDLWNTQVVPGLEMLAEALGLGGEGSVSFSTAIGILAGIFAQVQLESILQAIGLAINILVTAIRVAVLALRGWAVMSEQLGKAIGKVLKIALDFVKDVVKAFEWLKKMLVGGSIIPDIMKAMLKIITESVTKIVEFFRTKFTEIYNWLREIGRRILEEVRTRWESIKTAISTALAAIGTMIRTKFNGFITEVSTKLTAMKDKVVERMDAIKAWFAAKWDQIKTTFTTKLAEAKAIVTGALDDIKQALIDLDLTEAAKGIIDTIKKGFNDKVGEAKGVISGLISDIEGIVGGANLYQKGVDIINSLKDGILAQLNAILGEIQQKIADFWESVTNLLGDGDEAVPEAPTETTAQSFGQAFASAVMDSFSRQANPMVSSITGGTSYVFTMEVNTNAPVSTVMSDFDLMKAMAGAG